MLRSEGGRVRGGWALLVGVGSVTLSTSGTAMTPGGAPLALEFMPVTVTAQ